MALGPWDFLVSALDAFPGYVSGSAWNCRDGAVSNHPRAPCSRGRVSLVGMWALKGNYTSNYWILGVTSGPKAEPIGHERVDG